MSNIVKSGSHVLLIRSSSEMFLELEIVFFRCWTKLVYLFNRCQFICCGIIKKNSQGFINEQCSSPIFCSYFMKTVLCSVIQIGRTLIWTTDNIFAVSRTVSNYLITGFNTAYCPIFFIPQNNMFRLKGTGHMVFIVWSFVM